MSISNRILVLLGSILLMASVAATVFFSEPRLLFVPLLPMAMLLLVQDPTFLFYALLISIPWSLEHNFTESLGTDLPDEPLMLLLAFAVVAMLLVQQKRVATARRLPVLLLLLFISFAWTAITVCLSTNVLLSVKYLLAKGWYLLAFVGAPLVLKGDEKLTKRAAIFLFCSMFVATCVTMVRHASYRFAFININDALVPFFRNHVNYSALLVFMVPLQLSFYKVAKNRRQRWAIGFSLLVVLVALLLSYARGAWLALVVGLISYWLIKKRLLLKAYLFSFFVIALAVVWVQQNESYLRFAPHHNTTIFHENFAEHLIATYKGKDVSTAERFYRWVAGARMSSEKWLTGFGPTTFNQHYKSYTIPAFRTWVSDNKEQSTVHNYFLLLLIEQGIVGMLLFVVLVGVTFWQAQKIYHRTNSPFWKTTVAAIAAILWMQCTVNFLSDLSTLR